jgi:arylsulfatase A-like enzyme
MISESNNQKYEGINKMETAFSRRDFLKYIGVSLTTLVSSGYANTIRPLAQESKPEKPNILLIVSDDQGWGDTTCNWKNTDIETPVMDEIAKTGIRFTQFYVNPLCAPTRSSFFTGQYSMENGMWRGPSKAEDNDRIVKSNVRMLPQFLKEAGYRTGIFGKWHLGYQTPNTPNDRGFDEFYGFLGGAHPYTPTPARLLMHNSRPYHENLHLTDYFTKKAMFFIRDCARKKNPFFCYVPYNAVHGPLWRTERPKPSGKKQWLEKYAEKGIDFPRRDYNAILEHMDNSAGRLLKLLKTLKLDENTLVIYFSDNGACLMTPETKGNYPGNNGPFRGGKGGTYEGGVRVPCVMRWKHKFPEGLVCNDIVMHFDIFSTILDAAGLTVPRMNGQNPVHGRSLLRHISKVKEPIPERTVFWELFGKVAARKGKWKLIGQIENTRGNWDRTASELKNANLELYNLEKDISESNNLRIKNPKEYMELKKELITFFQNIK